MPRDLALPDPSADAEAYARAVRELRDHLLGAVAIDRRIGLNGHDYLVAWADRRPAPTAKTAFALTAGMRVVEADDGRPAAVLPTGEEQITLVIDGERLVFHLVEAARESGQPVLPGGRRDLLS
jgi:hypothetical protein